MEESTTIAERITVYSPTYKERVNGSTTIAASLTAVHSPTTTSEWIYRRPRCPARVGREPSQPPQSTPACQTPTTGRPGTRNKPSRKKKTEELQPKHIHARNQYGAAQNTAKNDTAVVRYTRNKPKRQTRNKPKSRRQQYRKEETKSQK